MRRCFAPRKQPIFATKNDRSERLLSPVKPSPGNARATHPDTIHQDFGLAANLMTQQVAIMAFMDCFHLLGLVVRNQISF